MNSEKHHPAALINAIAEEGKKDEAIEWLQKQWNENCELRAENERLRLALSMTTQFLPALMFSRTEEIIVSMLCKNESVTIDKLHFSLPRGTSACTKKDRSCIRVFVCNLQKKLPDGARIKNRRATGYYLDEESKRLIAPFMTANNALGVAA